MTGAARRAALEAIAAEVRTCTRCRLHEGRTTAVPGEGHPETDVVFIGEGPGFNEDRLGRPFVGRAGDFLVRLLRSIGWQREDVFITNVVKCRPPDNRDPESDEIAACAPYLRRQLEVLEPALIVTLGRHSMGRYMPGTTISRAHGTTAPVDPATGAARATVFALYHPAAALRSPATAEASFADVARIPAVLEVARRLRDGDAPAETTGPAATEPAVTEVPEAPVSAAAEAPEAVETGEASTRQPDAPAAVAAPAPAPAPAGSVAPAADQLTLFG